MNKRLTSPYLPLGIPAVLLLLAISTPAFAEGFDLQQFHPMPDQEHNYFSSASTSIAPHGHWSAFTVLNFAANPLVLLSEDGERRSRLVSSQTTLHVMGSLALFDRMDIGVDVPLILYQGGDSAPPDGGFAVDAGLGIGDLRLLPRVQLFASERASHEVGFALAAVLDVHLPTGKRDSFQGGDFRIGPRLVLDVLLPNDFRVGTNVGYQYRAEREVENLGVNDTFGWSLFGEFPIDDGLRVITEVFGRFTPAAGVDRMHTPMELSAGVKSPIGPSHVTAGLGIGLMNGYGSPDWRVFLGFGIPMPTEESPVILTETAGEPRPDPERNRNGTGTGARTPTRRRADGRERVPCREYSSDRIVRKDSLSHRLGRHRNALLRTPR